MLPNADGLFGTCYSTAPPIPKPDIERPNGAAIPQHACVVVYASLPKRGVLPGQTPTAFSPIIHLLRQDIALLKEDRSWRLDNVAMLRYLGTEFLGSEDGIIFKDPAMQIRAPPDEPLVVDRSCKAPVQYFFKPIEFDPDRSLPLYHKDILLHQSSLPSKSNAQKARKGASNSEEEGSKPKIYWLLGARDGGACQVSNKIRGLEAAHIVAFRRGPKIYKVIHANRTRDYHFPDLKQTEIDPRYTGGLNGTQNLIYLQQNLHLDFDDHQLSFLPLPNCSFAKDGSPLPYSDDSQGAVVGECRNASDLNTSLWIHDPSVEATRVAPLLVPFSFTGRPPVSTRLRGPSATQPGLWPHEGMCSYRFASAAAYWWGTSTFFKWTREWNTTRISPLDERQGSEATSVSHDVDDDEDDDGGDAGGSARDAPRDESDDDMQDREEDPATPKSSRNTRSRGRGQSGKTFGGGGRGSKRGRRANAGDQIREIRVGGVHSSKGNSMKKGVKRRAPDSLETTSGTGSLFSWQLQSIPVDETFCTGWIETNQEISRKINRGVKAKNGELPSPTENMEIVG